MHVVAAATWTDHASRRHLASAWCNYVLHGLINLRIIMIYCPARMHAHMTLRSHSIVHGVDATSAGLHGLGVNGNGAASAINLPSNLLLL